MLQQEEFFFQGASSVNNTQDWIFSKENLPEPSSWGFFECVCAGFFYVCRELKLGKKNW